jgi:hypothetical protein
MRHPGTEAANVPSLASPHRVAAAASPLRRLGHRTVHHAQLTQTSDGCPGDLHQSGSTSGRAVTYVARPYRHRPDLGDSRLLLQNVVVSGCQGIVSGCPTTTTLPEL